MSMDSTLFQKPIRVNFLARYQYLNLSKKWSAYELDPHKPLKIEFMEISKLLRSLNCTAIQLSIFVKLNILPF